MPFMKPYIFILSFVLLLSSLAAKAQTFSEVKQVDSTWAGATKQGVDTVPYVSLKEVVIPYTKKRKSYYRKLKKLTRNVMKTYPYAKVAGEIMQDCEKELANIKEEKERDEFMDLVEDQLKDEFEGELRKLTVSQGKMLIKLVDRETGKTSYDVIKQLKGGFSAFLWQSFAVLFGSNLKSEFDAEEDYMIDVIIQKIESGELKVEMRERKTSIKYVADV